MRSLGRVASSTRSITRSYPNIRRFATAIAALGLLLCPAAASAALPDGRAYELVSPAQKLSIDIHQSPEDPAFSPILSADGNSVAYTALDGLPGGTSNGFFNAFRAIRGASAWSLEQLNSPISPEFGINAAPIVAADPGLTTFVQSGPPSKPLTPDAADGVPNLYLRTDQGFRLITVGAPAFEPFFFTGFVAHSADFSHVAFTASVPLDEADPEGEPLYDWNAATGDPTIVGVLPNGDPIAGSVTLARPPVGSEFPSPSEPVQLWNPVSADGSRIFFEAEGQLFVRIGGTETKQVSESKRTEPDPEGPQQAKFRFAAADGSRAFFTSAEKLTDDSTSDAAGGSEDLYRYDVASGALTDITVDGDPGGAQIQGVLGGAQNGSRLYFVAKGELADGAEAGENNLYLWEDDGSAKGEITHIATGVDPSNWQSASFELPFRNRLTSHVTPDGESLLFESTSSLTGPPNDGHFAAYLFRIGEPLQCVSCNPDDVTPAASDALAVGTGDGVLRARVLTDDGKFAFFTSADQLVEEDTNQVADVYRFDVDAGTLALVSTGTSSLPAVFADASADGSDIAFTTRESLVGIDTDRAMDVYDARVGGGLASQLAPPPPPAPCTGLDCRGPVAATPPAAVPGTPTATGAQAKPKKQRKHRKKPKHKKQRSGKRNGQR